jgi:hypothetical protein
MALAPHWLDDVIGTKRTVDDVAKAICASPDFRAVVQQAIDNGLREEEFQRENPKAVGSNYTQSVRATIVRGVEQSKVNVEELV